MSNIINMGINSKNASIELLKLSENDKNEALISISHDIVKNMEYIIEANKKDLKNAIENGIKGAFIDRLTLTEERIKSMAKSVYDISKIEDSIGKYKSEKVLDNGLIIKQKIVPIGVIGIIFESRPNVTSDAFALCFKSGNSVILRGGSEAINSNIAIVDVIQKALEKRNISKYAIQIVKDTDREIALKMMKLNKYIDVLIPRGGASLINSVMQNSTVPVIQTGVGNCHIFVDETANQNDAINIILNAKTQRPGVCNAVEKLIIHKNIANDFLPKIYDALKSKNVEIRGDKKAVDIVNDIILVDDYDWETEYEDLIIAIKIADDIDDAINHIRTYTTNHSESIITQNVENSEKFLNDIDSAVLYVNASTRFTDGGQFGFGGEIGISTQKLHARGPMGVNELTTTKYVIYGNGHIRE